MIRRSLALQLPVEILQEIFLFLAGLYPLPSPFRSSGQPDWIAVTYICRYWREAALGMPKLWSSITPGLSVSWSRAMTERSFPLPMHINMRIGACYRDGLESFAASELLLVARIRTLRLSGYADDILNVIHDLRRPSPLESLSLQAVPTRVQSFDVNLPEALFGGEAPYCRRLTFDTSASIHAPRWLLTGITHLTTSANFALHVLLDVLHATPRLEVLCIVHMSTAWRDPTPPGGVPPQRVALPRLFLLSLHGTPGHLVAISSRLDVPPTLRRQLFWSTGPVWRGDDLTDTQALIPHDSAPGVDDGGLRIARVIGELERGSFEVWSRTDSESASAVAHEDALFLFNNNWNLPVRLRGCLARSYPFFRLASLCALLGTTRIEHLTVAPETAIEDAATAGEYATDVPTRKLPDVAAPWQALLATLPSVKTVRLHRGSPACLSVLRALSASADLLPHLERVLVVQSIVRYATARLDCTDVSGSGSAVAIREFVRANLGPELVDGVNERSGLEVVLIRCEVDNEALDALRKRARVVICDEPQY
ncbi:hypothetical protein EDB92DRAFT_320728 [Lactarius akahatsu]|uniref:F-box domain-containing protein n=1 Tax=Lactarius akahatsu TaxID=416441 RepID=A0AAD4LKT5_9AGAM|nr:hypothetical protein EDB92DRAFT_320728 [Lactarius akahatsu]